MHIFSVRSTDPLSALIRERLKQEVSLSSASMLQTECPSKHVRYTFPKEFASAFLPFRKPKQWTRNRASKVLPPSTRSPFKFFQYTLPQSSDLKILSLTLRADVLARFIYVSASAHVSTVSDFHSHVRVPTRPDRGESGASTR